jgi:hypothetical protein
MKYVYVTLATLLLYAVWLGAMMLTKAIITWLIYF